MSTLTDKIIKLHQALEDADIPHGFGGALALAWCTQHARGTIDIDLNIFIETEEAAQELIEVITAKAHNASLRL